MFKRGDKVTYLNETGEAEFVRQINAAQALVLEHGMEHVVSIHELILKDRKGKKGFVPDADKISSHSNAPTPSTDGRPMEIVYDYSALIKSYLSKSRQHWTRKRQHFAEIDLHLEELVPFPNRIEPWKRPRSSMAPTMVFGPDGELRMILGSPGGSRIIGYVAKTVIAMIDWQMTPQEAVSLPHFINRNGAYDLEAGTEIAELADDLRDEGYEVNIRGLNSGLHAILIDDDGDLLGGADPRREGVAIGEENMYDNLRDAFDELIPGGYPDTATD